MTFTPTIELGQLLIFLSIVSSAVGGYYTLKTRLDSLERLVEKFGVRLDRHEETITELVGQLQRVVGRIDGDEARSRRAH